MTSDRLRICRQAPADECRIHLMSGPMYLTGQTDPKPIRLPRNIIGIDWRLTEEAVEATEEALRPVLLALNKNIYRATHVFTLINNGMTCMQMYERARRVVADRDGSFTFGSAPSSEHMTSVWQEFFNPTGNWLDEIGGTDNERILAILNPSAQGEFVAPVLESFLVSIWAAFETFVGDLWESALNAHPMKLADLSGAEDRITKMVNEDRKRAALVSGMSPTKDQAALGSAAKDSKLIPLRSIYEVTQGSYNLAASMGTLLRASRRYDFSALGDTRRAYSAAFSYYSRGIDIALSDLGIDALNAVRNLLVHNAGVCDTAYLNCSRGLPLPVLDIGSKLTVDCDTVLSLVRPVFNRSLELVGSVSTWIHDESAGKHTVT